MSTLIQSTPIKIDLLESNIGQVEGLPSNPRTICGEKFNDLKKSLTDNPEMMYLRECIVFPNNGKYVIIGGNQRYEACKELGYTEIPCKILPSDTPAEVLRAVTLKDNYGYGEWDKELLAEEWDLSEIADLDMEEILGFAKGETDGIMEEETGEIPQGNGEVQAFGAHPVALRFGDYKCEMTEEEFCWLRETFMAYKHDYESTDGFVNHLKEKYESARY